MSQSLSALARGASLLFVQQWVCTVLETRLWLVVPCLAQEIVTYKHLRASVCGRKHNIYIHICVHSSPLQFQHVHPERMMPAAREPRQ
jgi:hypothetical protein